jgi:nucleotide-binding universal stress UspA family protein
MTRRILVALDDSSSSQRAAEFVHDFFAPATDIEVLGVNVAHLPRPWIAPGLGYGVVMPPSSPGMTLEPGREVDVERLEEAARDRASEVLDANELAGARPLGAVGDPVAAIVAAARQHDVDVIVVGGDEAGFLGRLLDRSVARGLLRDAGRPILVVPTADDDGHDGDASAR